MNGLDLFCGAGGASRGYVNAGHTITGIDITPQPHYPYTFWHGDALQLLRQLLDGQRLYINDDEPQGLDDFDFIHASPPCQLFSAGNRANTNNRHPNLVDPTRQLLKQTGLPYIIENVPGAPLYNPVELCGRQFGLTAVDNDGTVLQLDRHRQFETSFALETPASCRPHSREVQVAGVYGGARRDKHDARHVRHGGYVPSSLNVLRQLMRIEWMDEKELFLAIPPVYTWWIGERIR